MFGNIGLEGTKSGNNVSFICSVAEKPLGSSVEFLIDGITACNIRLYNRKCYQTSSWIPCYSEKCQCSADGRKYSWTYQYKSERFRASCKAVYEDDCSANATILLTEDVNHASKVNPADDCMKPVSCCTKGKIDLIVLGMSMFILFFMNRYGSFHALSCVYIVAFNSHSGLCDKEISMAWISVNDKLEVYCDVKHLHSSVELKDPRGLEYHCTAAIANLAPGDCTKKLQGSLPFKMTQDIRKNRTTVILTNDQIECENGIWQCMHGTKTGQVTNTTVSVRRNRNWERKTIFSDLTTDEKVVQCFCHLGLLLISNIICTFCCSVLYYTSCNKTTTNGIIPKLRHICKHIEGPPGIMWFRFIMLVVGFSYSIVFVILNDGQSMYYLILTTGLGLVYGIVDSCICIHCNCSNGNTSGESNLSNGARTELESLKEN